MLQEPLRVTEARLKRVTVLAGPLGFYGDAYGLVVGKCRGDRQAALCDVSDAADLIDVGGVSAVAHAWRMID